MLLPSAIQRADDLVGMATPIRSPLAASASGTAMPASIVAASASLKNDCLVIISPPVVLSSRAPDRRTPR